jgi:hypothetical protein
MNLKISAKFKLLDEQKEFCALTDITIDIPCSNKEVTTEKIYYLLKEEALNSIPNGYTVENLTDEEYRKIKDEEED